MIELYTFGTPNGRKVAIMLEECGLPYRVKKIDITQGDQFTPAYLQLNPNGKIPSLVDPDGPDGQPIALMESGAILLYLAGKCGRFLPAATRGKYAALQWLMFQMGSIGPMFGQCHHFLRYAPERVDYAIDRYTRETARLYGVLEKHLAAHDFLADEYSVADMAVFPWVAQHDWQNIIISDYPSVLQWFKTVANRPAVQRGMAVPA